MKYLKSILFLLIASSLFTLYYLTSPVPSAMKNAGTKQSEYTVAGRVIDENNRPVAGVRVSSMIADKPPRGRMSMSRTDKEGRFRLGNVEPGDNFIITEKEEDGYASTINGVLATSRPPQILVDDAHPHPEVEVRLGAKSPRISGTVATANGAKSIENANLKICLANMPEMCYSTIISSQFDLLAPLTPFTLEVASQDYTPWIYGQNNGKDSAVKTLALSPNERRQVNITLESK